MTRLPVFIDMRLSAENDAAHARSILKAALKETARDLHVLAPDTGTVADIVVTDAPDRDRDRAPILLAVAGGRISLATRQTLLQPLEGEALHAALREALFMDPDEAATIADAWAGVQKRRLPRIALRLWYPLLLRLAGGRAIRRHEWRPATRAVPDLAPQPAPDAAQMALLRDKADALADLYAQKYRSAFVGRFLLSAVVAVFVAFLLFILPAGKSVAYAAEFVATVVIIVSFKAALIGNWKGKWLSNRYIAESLRLILTLGRDSHAFLLENRSFPDDAVEPEERLVDWCARQMMLSAQDEAGTAQEYDQTRYLPLLHDQIAYHRARLAQLSRVERRLGGIGLGAFLGSMLLALASFSGLWLAPGLMEMLGSPVALALGILPAVGAALFAIRVQSNFNADALHSNVLINRLTALAQRAEDASPQALAMQRARFVALQKAEFDDWKSVQQGRALDLP